MSTVLISLVVSSDRQFHRSILCGDQGVEGSDSPGFVRKWSEHHEKLGLKRASSFTQVSFVGPIIRIIVCRGSKMGSPLSLPFSNTF